MVFKPFTTLARQSISKHLVNGYAQSVVAATQSSYASSTIPIKFGASNAPAKLHTAFGGAHSGRAAPKDGSGSDIVNAFYAAQSSADDNDKKYLFSGKILWSKAQHQKQQKQLLGSTPEPITEPLPRPEALLAIEEADVVEAKDGKVIEAVVEAAAEEPEQIAEPTQVFSEEALMPEPSQATKDLNLQLSSLHEQGRWEEVTVVFHHVVDMGTPADTTTYNLLLDSIVHMRPRHISQVLDVYHKMLREGVVATTTTYSILVNFLAARALKSLEILTNTKAEATKFNLMLASKARAIQELKDEGAIEVALGLFYECTETRTERVFPGAVYSVLVEACSRNNRPEDMLNVVAHMESHGLAPSSETVRSMIRGYGATDNVRSAIETYNNWQTMAVARDPSLMDERYRVYMDLIKAYMDCGDAPGALTFLEKVADISHELGRLEWLKQAVVEGFVSQGDIQSAKTWSEQLSIQLTSNEWLSQLMTSVADQGELPFARQIYNSININNMEFRTPQIQQFFSECQMAALALCIRSDEVTLARDLWRDLSNPEISAGPNITAALMYTNMLFEKGLTNEALVVLNHFSGFFLERLVASPGGVQDHFLGFDAKTVLQEGFEWVIINLSSKDLLTPSIALDVAGFSITHCGALGANASRHVLALFDATRLMGLTPSQLSLTLQLQTAVMEEDIYTEDAKTFEFMFNLGLKAELPTTGNIAYSIQRGITILSHVIPDLQNQWNSYVQQQHFRQSSPISPMHSSPTSTAPTMLTDSSIRDPEKFDPYWEKTDYKTSSMIDSILERSPMYQKIHDLRRMYRSTRRAGNVIRLLTLAKMVAATSRTKMHEDFIDEIARNAKIDTPPMLDFPTAKFGWGCFLDSLIAAQLNLGNHDKALFYHGELLQIGATPSANTYGLYIVSLKSTHQTYDEATEALAIFNQAISENVTPTPFLYNAVIGKLAKARRVDDCLAFFKTMRESGLTPTSVTFGTMINALTRVGEETQAEILFEEMESMPKYKPKPAPYNSLIQFFITAKRDRSKVLTYYKRMLAKGIKPTSHTYKLLIEAYATLDKPDMEAAERVLESIQSSDVAVESSHHAALIHAKGCVLHDVEGAIKHFESVFMAGKIQPDSTLYQALLECLVANHKVTETSRWVRDMASQRIQMTPYIANTLIHGWSLEKNIAKAREVYESLGSRAGQVRREPSTYEAMVRAYLAVGDQDGAKSVANEMMSRGYPNAVVARVMDLVRMMSEHEVNHMA